MTTSSSTPTSSTPQLRPWQRVLLWAAVLAVLLGVFALYTQPHFMVTLADAVWACF